MARITITVTLDTDRDPVSAEEAALWAEGAENLAAIMYVKAEDGLYSLGSPDDEDSEHLVGFAKTDFEVNIDV